MRPAAKRLIQVPAAAALLALASGAAAAWIASQPLSWLPAAMVLARVVASLLFRLDRLYWPDLTFRDAVTAMLAACGGSAIAAAFAATLPGPWPARLLAAELCVFALLTLLCAVLPRSLRLRGQVAAPHATRTLIWGAGETGRALLAHLRADPRVEIFGWLDDDPALAEIDRDGVPVLGPIESLPLLVELHGVQTVLVAARRLSPERRAFAEDLARWSGANLVAAPGHAASLQALETLAPHAAIAYTENRAL